MSQGGERAITVVPELSFGLFALFALANMSGYNSDNRWEFSHVRRMVRSKLASRAKYWRSVLEKSGLLLYMQRGGGGKLMDLVPQLSPSDLAWNSSVTVRTSWQTDSGAALQGLEPVLHDFVEQESILGLWSSLRGLYEESARELQRGFGTLERIARQFGEPLGSGAFVILLLPNLLDAHGRGYSVSTEERTWLFIGPVQNEEQGSEIAVHELVHRWVDWACDRHLCFDNVPDPMPQAKAQFRIVADLYPELPIWVGETIVRAATAWLVPNLRYLERQGTKELLSYYEQIGFVGISDAYELFAHGTSMSATLGECVGLVRDRVLEQFT
jgi:hypothetical protein